MKYISQVMLGGFFSLGTLNLDENNFGVSAAEELLATVLRFEFPEPCQ